MTPEDFKIWRKAMGLKRKETAKLLGVRKSTITRYETEENERKHRAIPKSVELACFALSRGISEFDGRTAKNSFNGLGSSEEIKTVKTKKSAGSSQSKAKIRVKVSGKRSDN